jgi:LysR family nitrogen assimilation transcriptional regulator
LDTRRLDAFIKVVDLGSVTRAASVLGVAQPALSQQIASLETEFKRQLLVRSARGVAPTEAGHILYRYAKVIQRKIDEARRNILEGEQELTGNVTIGLAPFSSASLLATPLLAEVRRLHPGIVLHIFDSFGVPLSEMMLKGSMDMAILYGDKSIRGLDYKPLVREQFHLMAPRTMLPSDPWSAEISATELAQLDLLLPSRESFLRQAIERVCNEVGAHLRIVAEIHSQFTLASAITMGMGATVLPAQVAETLPGYNNLCSRPIAGPASSLQMSLCISDYAGLSDAAFAVYNILLELIGRQFTSLPDDAAATGE